MRSGVVLAISLAFGGVAGAEWAPASWANLSTLELRTTAPGDAPHWFKVWLVVLDGQLYVRLGTRAAERVRKNETAPVVGLRVAHQEFAGVKAVEAPQDRERVARAMADKYWSDVFVRHFAHPMIVRLVPQ